MELFTILFVPVMLATPAIASLLVRPAPGADIDRARVRRLRRRLLLGTALGLALFAALHILRRTGSLAFWDELPAITTWNTPPDRILWVLFFPLWFVGFMPLLRAARPSAASPYPSGAAPAAARRTASLRPRAARSPIPRGLWAVGWVIWAGAAAAVAARAWATGDARPVPWLAAVSILCVAPFGWAFGPFAVRLALTEPEPLDVRGSEELCEAYRRLRDAKAWGFYWLLLALLALFSVMAALVAWSATSGAALGLCGGIGGSLVGVFGAVFGVRMGIARLRVKERLDELVASEKRG